VRVWEQPDPKEPRWRQAYQLEHYAVVRAVACTPPAARANLLLTGTADGWGRLFDLGDLAKAPWELAGRHDGPITCLAFSPDGSVCATGGEDREVCLWATATGRLLHRIPAAHKAAVTSLQFASATRLVSAGNDKRLVVWALAGDKAPAAADELDHRSGEVGQLGLDPTGERTLFDEGRELRVLSLATRRIEGTLQNPAGAVNFSTLALFSPDGKTILTNGAAQGRLQLWRAPGADGRGGELRQYLWNSAPVTCGAFAPGAAFAVTGTQDRQVLVWGLPGQPDNVVTGELSFVDEFVDTSLKRVAVRVEISKAPRWMIPGATATLVIPPAGG
jgi:WD40 repeat protein